MKGARREVAQREHEQLARWLRTAMTSGDGMPSIRAICARFQCGSHTARRMLEKQCAAGVITMKSGSGGARPAAQPARSNHVGR